MVDNPAPEPEEIPVATPAAPAASEVVQGLALSSTTVATTGKRQALRDIRRQLQESELSSSGVQKLLIEMLERAESECEIAEGYRDRYHDADKRAAVLEEKARTQTSLEILFGSGLTIGGALIGLTPSLGPIALAFGAVLVLGAILGRVVKR
jgi:hypothetical protein